MWLASTARLEGEEVGDGNRVKETDIGTEWGRWKWGQSEGDRRGETRGESEGVKRETSRQRQEVMEEENQ